VVPKFQIRFKKTRARRQADRESAAYMGVCEHLPEACDAPQCNRIDANPASLGNAAIGP